MPLSRQELFDLWAPRDSQWSAWAKPVLFAEARTSATKIPDLTWDSLDQLSYARDAAIIVDVPGTDSVAIGLALAKIGYQPVPLYNGAPAVGSIINMGAISDALAACASRLQQMKLAGARPAFLMNADRMSHSASALIPGRFDNRWCVVPQDMPSGQYLMRAGIRQIVLIGDTVADDLAHILFRYKEAGLSLKQFPKNARALSALSVNKPAAYKAIWYRALVFAGLRRSATGGFGAHIPDPGSGAGG